MTSVPQRPRVQRFTAMPARLKSSYLADFFDNEKMHIHDIVYRPDKSTLEALVDIQMPYVGSSAHNVENLSAGFGEFHLSGLSASIAVTHLAIAYACLYRGLSKKELGEMVQLEFHMRNKRGITKKKNIRFKLEMNKIREVNGTVPGLLATFNYTISAGAVTGYLTGLLPN